MHVESQFFVQYETESHILYVLITKQTNFKLFFIYYTAGSNKHYKTRNNFPRTYDQTFREVSRIYSLNPGELAIISPREQCCELWLLKMKPFHGGGVGTICLFQLI